MRFLIDEQLPPALADQLRSAGHPADHVLRLGLGGVPDREIWSRCAALGAVLVSKNIDFVGRALGPNPQCQVVWLRVGNTTARALWRTLEPILPQIVAALEAGERLVEVT